MTTRDSVSYGRIYNHQWRGPILSSPLLTSNCRNDFLERRHRMPQNYFQSTSSRRRGVLYSLEFLIDIYFSFESPPSQPDVELMVHQAGFHVFSSSSGSTLQMTPSYDTISWDNFLAGTTWQESGLTIGDNSDQHSTGRTRLLQRDFQSILDVS